MADLEMRAYSYLEILMLPALISPKQAASLAGCSERTVLRLCSQGRVPAARLGSAWKIRTAELLEMLGLTKGVEEARRVAASGAGELLSTLAAGGLGRG
jgi:excisionase family DNA binding protein